MGDFHSADVPRIRELIDQLNTIAQQRKDCVDRLWVLEDEGERKRNDLMRLLRRP